MPSDDFRSHPVGCSDDVTLFVVVITGFVDEIELFCGAEIGQLDERQRCVEKNIRTFIIF